MRPLLSAFTECAELRGERVVILIKVDAPGSQVRAKLPVLLRRRAGEYNVTVDTLATIAEPASFGVGTAEAREALAASTPCVGLEAQP